MIHAKWTRFKDKLPHTFDCFVTDRKVVYLEGVNSLSEWKEFISEEPELCWCPIELPQVPEEL